MRAEIEKIHNDLGKYCSSDQYKGWDPFDGLNSCLIQGIPLLKNNRFVRLVWLQFFKRSPLNFRNLVGVKKGYNAKGLALFLSSKCRVYKKTNYDPVLLEEIQWFVNKLIEFKNVKYCGACWGYNFDWQARAFFQPEGTPSVVVTSYVSCALLDAYDILKDDRLLKLARSACDFVLKDLNRTYDSEGDFSFSYSPLDKTQVYNASLLGVRLLMRVYKYTEEVDLLHESRRAVSFVCKRQGIDGSWTYGTLAHHQWIDNFHTGYNLECLEIYRIESGDDSFKENIEKGLRYYLTTFFEGGVPHYYSNNKYPIDVHNTAQLVVTLDMLGVIEVNRDLVDRVMKWTIDNMYDQKRGFFYYYKEEWFTNKIPYIRWVQAWMYYGMSVYLDNRNESCN